MRDKLNVSAITLGTVQLGFPYGLANQLGQPGVEQSHRLLRKALECGVSTWDTARHYGTAESVIGSFVKSNASENAPLVVTKFKWDNSAFSDKGEALRQAIQHVQDSCEQLGSERLPVLLFHKDKDQSIRQVMRILPDVLRSLQGEGLIAYGGISIYFADEAKAVIDEPTIQAIQAPMNVLDQRMIQNGALRDFYDMGKTVFIRSIFLQGLFFMDETQLPQKLSGAKPYLKQLQVLASEADMDTAQFAFSYVRDTIGVTSVVFGAETEEQVIRNAQLSKGPCIPESIRAKASMLFGNVPEQIITPGLW